MQQILQPQVFGPKLLQRLALVWALIAPLAACGDPCRDLSDTVCNCMPSRQEQQACRKRVHALAAQNSDLSRDAKATCSELLQTCSCEALAQGDFSACGLAQD